MTLTQHFTLRDEKKHSVRYDATVASQPAGIPPVLTGIYISKHHLSTPFPKYLLITVEEANSYGS